MNSLHAKASKQQAGAGDRAGRLPRRAPRRCCWPRRVARGWEFGLPLHGIIWSISSLRSRASSTRTCSPLCDDTALLGACLLMLERSGHEAVDDPDLVFKRDGGGFNRLDRIFNGELPGVLEAFNEAIWSPA